LKSAKIKSLGEDIGAKSRALKEIREKLPIKDDKDPEFEKKVMKAYDDKRKELERQIETQNLTGPEERRLISKMTDIKKEKATLLPQYKRVKEALAKDIALKEQLISLGQQDQLKIDSVKENDAALRKQRDEKRAQEAEVNERIEKIREARENEKKLVGELLLEKQLKHEAISHKINQHYEKLKLDRERKEKAREEKIAAAEQKRKEREEQRKREEAERIPLEEEINVCNSALSYLEAQLKIVSAEKKKQQRSQRQRGERAFYHPPEVTTWFEFLSVSLPLLQTELEGSLSQVKAKKEFFLGLQKIELEKRSNPNYVPPQEEKLENPDPEVLASIPEEIKVEETSSLESRDIPSSSFSDSPAEVSEDNQALELVVVEQSESAQSHSEPKVQVHHSSSSDHAESSSSSSSSSLHNQHQHEKKEEKDSQESHSEAKPVENHNENSTVVSDDLLSSIRHSNFPFYYNALKAK